MGAAASVVAMPIKVVGDHRFHDDDPAPTVLFMTSNDRLVRLGDVELCIETLGDPADPAVLLIQGAAASTLWWELELCRRIAARGRYVIRYDNRDTGHSTNYPPGRPGYAMSDLARDAVGILDCLQIDRAHVVAQSMSGGIALILGVDHPTRVASLTFVSSSTGEPGLPPPSSMLRRPEPSFDDLPAVVDYIVSSARAEAGGSPYFDEQAMRALVEQDVARTRNIASALTNHYAQQFDGPVGGGYGDITAPTLVVHGDRDPLFPLAHGEALRDAIPDAKLLVLEQAGHGVPRALWVVFVAALIQHTAA
jgi:pimeloyl-ACP methyl ester carboxylesterase